MSTSIDATTLTRGLRRGVTGGLVATVAMSAVMFGAQKVGLLGRMPPQKITNRFLHLTGLGIFAPKRAKQAAGTLAHFAFGAGAGALFGVANEVWRARAAGTSDGAEARGRSHAPILAGLAFGTAVWAASYKGWVPALGIMRSPKNDRSGRPTTMVAAHWVFGAVLAKLVA